LTGEPVVAAVGAAVQRIFDVLGVPRRLRDAGVPAAGLGGIAASAMDDWFLRGNPRPVRDVSELQQVLEETW
jgi:alcohol dehydrogenase